MKSIIKLGSGVGVGLFAVLALSGCINQGSGFEVLDREAESSDALPTDLPDYAYDGLNASSSRLVGEHDDNALYLVKSREDSRICLLVYPDGSPDWIIGCGGAPWFGVGGLSGNYVVRADAPDGAPAPDDAPVEVAPNIFTSE